MAFTARDCECPNCGAIYFKTESWKRVCLDCYIDVKRAEEGLPPKDRTAKAKAKPQQKAKPDFNHDNFWGNFHQSAAKPAQPTGGIDKEMLRRLIQLCHPDKHGGSVAANTATQWLLKQKA